jgi:hypothetical protein
MKLAKIFAVLAAICLVGAVAVGTLGPDEMSLGEGLAALDRLHLSAAEHFVRLHLSDWLWDHPIKALLVRPIWLVPASLGLLLAGACATAANSGGSPLNSRRRRS